MNEEIVQRAIRKLNPTQRAILLRVRGDDWFPIQWEGKRSFFGWRTMASLGLAWPREPGMQTLSTFGRQVRDYAVAQNSEREAIARLTDDLLTYAADCAKLHEVQHGHECLVKPRGGASVILWAAEEIAALRARPTP